MREIITPSTFTAQVESIVTAGGTITEKFRTIAARWDDYSSNDHTMQDELNAAILDPGTTSERLAHLRILAEAEAASSPVTAATVRNTAAAEVVAALRVEYRTVAAANYDTIREAFNAKAGELVKALETTDSEASAENIVKATAKERAAWSDGPALAIELSALLGTLHTAATLAGLRAYTGKLDSILIGLTVNAEGLHRRRVWEAWDNTTSRAGRWRELWNLGATIEAPELDDAKPYREPAPMETRAQHIGTGVRQYVHDPEDDAHQVERHQLQKTALQAGIQQVDYSDTEANAVHVN
jgi:hypothetical protein